MYFIGEFKRLTICSKNLWYTVLSIIVYIISFLSIKTKFFFEVINYIPIYVNYYVHKYLNADFNQLISNNKLWIYVENDVDKIFSSTYIYFVSQQSILYLITIIVVPVIIFHFVNRHLYDELNSKFFKNITFRIGNLKYMLSKISLLSLYGGLIAVIPKIGYLLLLKIFYTNGFSLLHYLGNPSFVPKQYLFFQGNINPSQMLALDLSMTFVYGIIIAIISMIIVVISDRKVLSYLSFIVLLFMQCILSIVLVAKFHISIMPPFIYMFSILKYIFSFATIPTVSSIVIQCGTILFVLLLVLIFAFKRKIKVLL